MARIIKAIVSRDAPTDGFDPDVPYQMVPLQGTRDIMVETFENKAELSFRTAGVARMSNFRIRRQSVPSLFPLPGPAELVERIVLPERSLIELTLTGMRIEMTALDARERLPSGALEPTPRLILAVSVKEHHTRTFAVCYLFDRVNRDTGRRLGFGRHFEDVSTIWLDQANFTLTNVDGHNSSSDFARTLIVPGSLGAVLDVENNANIQMIVDAFDLRFPGLFHQHHAIVFASPVPVRSQGLLRDGIAVKFRRTFDQRTFSMIFIPPHTQDDVLRHTIAHEVGHSLGLGHVPEKIPDNLPQDAPILRLVDSHNMMFPNNVLLSNRLNASQIELVHLLGPQFRELNI
ncbi:hypothetical protein [Arvimicrobium flavum]|uniref:hypothetical protein n=1 Tax=Arvimicrobium flavum TaxID=3393320 RepID=UPI00237BF586|nr:hypothetical protein [Mesorhizobium shangrilense]